jgi:molybdopterin synthase sulfur carrier subunit
MTPQIANELPMDSFDPATPSVDQQLTLSVLYFARLKEALGRSSERVSLPGSVRTVAGLREHLRTRGGNWETELAPDKAVRAAVNQEMADRDVPLRDGDEVAFFPPVTGG